ncbi:MAG: protein kinase [Gemmataceae bacterium]|nr:protein kinase [Gemmataceae bacterium]
MTRAVVSDLGRIASYALVKRLSVSGQGTVYKAVDPLTGGDLAIKVLSEQMVKDPVQRMRFAQECQITRGLRHPHIVRVLDFGLDGNKPYLVMEYVQGESLADRVDRAGPLTEDEAVKVITQIGQALQAVHNIGLLHRDVTPDSILVTDDGDAKLTDLSLVKNTGGDFNLTQTQSVLGTPNFMAPEQFEDSKRVDALSDLYGLAATMYAAVTGVLPFRAKSSFALGAIYKKKLVNDIAAPRTLAPALSERVDAAIRQGLRADRKERPASVREFLELLEEPPAPAVPAPAVQEPPSVEISLAPPPEPAPAPKKAACGDRRGAPRIAAKIGAACRPLERCTDAAAWRGKLVNISETGLCLELKRRFEVGTVLTISMGGKKHQRRSLLARVMWAKKAVHDRWRLGCHYDQPLSADEVQDLV